MNLLACRAYLEELLRSGVKFGLENVRVLLASLDNPHHRYPSVLVAGTNGKGSVCAMLSRILEVHGIRAGLYTSPHLIRIEERIRVGGRPISGKDFCRLLSQLKTQVEKLVERKELPSPPTFFETLTVLALLYFAEQGVEMAVLEVGMGGRLDATNAVTPLVSVITSVSKDHMEYLGTRIGDIAFEKAGIIKPGVPVVCGLKKSIAYGIVKKRASELGAPFLGVFDRAGSFKMIKGRKDFCFFYRLDGETLTFRPSLKGEHQGQNAAVAAAVAKALSRSWRVLESRKIVEGIESTEWPGRLEVVSEKPLVILDGAHNEAGAGALRDYIEDFIRRRLILVFGAMRDKDIRKMGEILFPLAEKIVITSFPYERAASPEKILASTSRFREKISIEPEPKKALAEALARAGKRSAVVVTGSLFLVGEVKKALQP